MFVVCVNLEYNYLRINFSSSAIYLSIFTLMNYSSKYNEVKLDNVQLFKKKIKINKK